jgi:hypothetical protein
VVPRKFNGTVVCIGTGPSLTMEQVQVARDKGFVLTGCNNVFLDVPDLAVLYACNYEWWDAYWGAVANHPCEKWTTNVEAAERFGLNWIAEKNADGLSTDPNLVHHGHGSGYSLVNLVYLMGATRIVLLGYDLRYSSSYDGKNRVIGPTPRHYWGDNGGEYPTLLQHWPSVHVHGGVHTELCRLYGTVAKQGAVEIINASPDSALRCFPMASIDTVES